MSHYKVKSKLKRVFIFILLQLVINNSFSQYDNYFYLNDVSFEDYFYKCQKPDALKFTNDGQYLYIFYHGQNNSRILKFDCNQKRTIFDKTYSVPYAIDIKEYQNKLLINSKGTIYYLPSFEEPTKSYPIDVYGGLSYSWVNKDYILLGGKVFSLESWTYSKNINENEAIKISQEAEVPIDYNKYYQLYFGKTTEHDISGFSQHGLWIQNINDPLSQKSIFYDNNYELIQPIVSPNSKRVAYYRKENLVIKTSYIQKKNYKYYSFDLINFSDQKTVETIERKKEFLAEKLKLGCYVEAKVFFPRIHPVTNAVIEGGVNLKSICQVVGISGNTVIVRDLNSDNQNRIYENDFVKFIYSTETKISYQPRNVNFSAGWIPEEYYEKYHRPIKIDLNSRLKAYENNLAFVQNEKSKELTISTTNNKSIDNGNDVNSKTSTSTNKHILISLQKTDTLWCTEFDIVVTDELGLENNIKNGITKIFSEFGNFKTFLPFSNTPIFKKIGITLRLDFSYLASEKQGRQEYFANCNYTFILVNKENGKVIKEYTKKLTTMDVGSIFLKGASNQKDALGNILSGKVKKEIKKSCEYLSF